MATFTITAPDGKKYNVTGDTAEGALQALKKHLGGVSAAPVPAAATPTPAASKSNDVSGLSMRVKGGSIADPFLQGLTLGAADEIAGGIGGLVSAATGGSFDKGYGDITGRMRQDAADYAERNPVTSAAAEIVGSFPSAMIPVGAVAKGASLATKVGRGALAGGGLGSIYGFNTGEGGFANRMDNATGNMLVGAGTGAAIPIIARGVGKVFGGRGSTAIKDLAAAKTAAYAKVDALGAKYSPAAFDGMVSSLGNDMKAAKLNPKLHPKAAAMLEELQAMRGQAPTLTELDQLRQIIRRDVAGSDAESFFAKKMMNAIDDLVDNAKTGDLIGGNPLENSVAMRSAREVNTRFKKLEAFNDAVETAKRNAAKSGTGGNVENAIRQSGDKILKSLPNLTPEEKAAANRVVFGTKPQNVLRHIGKLSPTTGGLTSLLAMIGTGLEPRLAAPFAAGFAAKTGAEAMAARNMRRLQSLIEGPFVRPAVSPRALQIENIINGVFSPPSRVGAPLLLGPSRAVPAGR